MRILASRRRLAAVLAFLILPGILIPSNFTRAQQRPTQKKLNVAVFDFLSRGGLTSEEAMSLSDIFQAQLVQSNEFVIVDRTRIKEILIEQGFQRSESCSQVECLVEAGKILKVERMFTGTIGKVGSVFLVTIQQIDITTAQVVSTKSRQHSGDVEDLAREIIPELAAEMASELTGKKISPVITSTGTGWLWYVGGVVLMGGAAAGYYFLKPGDQQSTSGTADLPRPPKPPNWP